MGSKKTEHHRDDTLLLNLLTKNNYSVYRKGDTIHWNPSLVASIFIKHFYFTSESSTHFYVKPKNGIMDFFRKFNVHATFTPFFHHGKKYFIGTIFRFETMEYITFRVRENDSMSILAFIRVMDELFGVNESEEADDSDSN